MSRKIIRNGLRRVAEIKGFSQSRFVHHAFDKYQTKQLGVEGRKITKAIGTKPKRVWKSRIKFALDQK